MRIKFMFFATFILIAIAGCNKDELSPTNPYFTIKEGMICFKSSDAFFKTTELLHLMNQNEVEAWLVKNDFNNSLLFRLNEMDDCNKHDADDPSLTTNDIHDIYFAALLNVDGIVSIGDTLSYVTKSCEYVITNGDRSIIEKIKANPISQFPSVIKNELRPQLKSGSIGVTYREPYQPDEYREVECELWVEIWFWKNSVTIEVDMSYATGTASWYRDVMAMCSIDLNGEVGTAESGDPITYKTLHYSGIQYETEVHKQTAYKVTRYYNTETCVKNVTADVQVKRYSYDDASIHHFDFPDLCMD